MRNILYLSLIFTLHFMTKYTNVHIFFLNINKFELETKNKFNFSNIPVFRKNIILPPNKKKKYAHGKFAFLHYPQRMH